MWEVDTGYAVSPRVRKKFDDEDTALAFAERLRAQRKNEGLSAFDLTIAQREDARSAFKVLEGTGATLTEAARFLASHRRLVRTGKKVEEVWAELVEFKETIQRKRPAYIRDLRTRLRRFVDVFGNRPIADIRAEEIQEWLYSDRTITDLTRRNSYALLSVFFSFAIGRRSKRQPTAQPYRVDNPIESVARPEFTREPPGILTVEQADALLAKAHETERELGLLPYVTLGLFCGIRTAELAALNWDDVNFRKRQVTIPARIAKKRRLRNIPIPDNAMAWLASYQGRKGPIAPPNSAHKLVRLARAAGVEPWPHNALRHSFGSYHFALTENAPETAARLGHKGDDILFEHYRALADKDDARRYFAILPQDASHETKVLPFTSAA